MMVSKNLYEIVGDKIREFCDNSYYGDIIISFEQSYNGKEWTKEVEFASFDGCTDLYYENDWNEGQKYIRKLRIWHLEDSEPVKHGRWLKNGCRYCECSVCHQEGNITGADNYCLNCGAKMDEV